MVFVNSSEAARWGRFEAFTEALLRALDGAADSDADGIVTLQEAFRFVVPEVQRNIERVNAVKLKGDPQHVPVTQTPVLYANPVLRAAPLAKAEPRALRLPPAQAVSR